MLLVGCVNLLVIFMVSSLNARKATIKGILPCQKVVSFSNTKLILIKAHRASVLLAALKATTSLQNDVDWNDEAPKDAFVGNRRDDNPYPGFRFHAYGSCYLQIYNAQDQKSEANYSANDQVSGKVGFGIISSCDHRYYASYNGKCN